MRHFCKILPVVGALLAVPAIACDAEDADTPRPETFAAQLDSVVIAVGESASSYTVLTADADAPVQIRLTVKGGEATFEDGSVVREFTLDGSGSAQMPAIRGASAPDESFIAVLANGQELGEVRVATIEATSFDELMTYQEAFARDRVLFLLGAHAALVDEAEFLALADDTGTEQFTSINGEDYVTRGACIRTPFGPGWVKWNFSNPKGQGYSIKPEGPNTLIWAKAPEQGLDWILRRSWGCNHAFKVPDHCTATVNSNGSISCCCNAAASLIKGSCRSIDPATEPGGPFLACPL